MTRQDRRLPSLEAPRHGSGNPHVPLRVTLVDADAFDEAAEVTRTVLRLAEESGNVWAVPSPTRYAPVVALVTVASSLARLLDI